MPNIKATKFTLTSTDGFVQIAVSKTNEVSIRIRYSDSKYGTRWSSWTLIPFDSSQWIVDRDCRVQPCSSARPKPIPQKLLDGLSLLLPGVY